MKKILLSLILAVLPLASYADTFPRPPVAADTASPAACAAYAQGMSDAIIKDPEYVIFQNGIWYSGIARTDLQGHTAQVNTDGHVTNYYYVTDNMTAGTFFCSVAGMSSAASNMLYQELTIAYGEYKTTEFLDDTRLNRYYGFSGDASVCTYNHLEGCSILMAH